MGFSQSDLAEQQGRFLDLDKIRWGPRMQPRERMNVSFMGQPIADPPQKKPPPVSKRRKLPDDESSYDVKYQRRLW